MSAVAEESLLIAGFGGQGILLAGRILAEAALVAGKEVVWVPAYGPEVRGGTANCIVKVAEGQIGSVTVNEPDVLLVLNRPSFLKYEPLVKPGGLLLVNSSLVPDKSTRTDITIVEVDASLVAEELGTVKAANMVMVGALAACRDWLQLDLLEETLKTVLSGKLVKLIPLNLAAIQKGYALAGGR